MNGDLFDQISRGLLGGLDAVHRVLGVLGILPEWVFVLIGCVIVLLLLGARGVSYLFALPYIWMTRLFRVLGFFHDQREWSVVYDSVSKLPIDPAYVKVRDTLGRTVASAVTDLDGRFGALLPPGLYTIEVEKTNYVFPSAKLIGKQTDGFYTGIYTGGQIEISHGERALAFAIPMDPIGDDWNQTEKKEKGISQKPEALRTYAKAAGVYMVLGGVLLLLRLRAGLLVQPFVLGASILVLWLIVRMVRLSKTYYHSIVVHKATGRPVPFARIKVFTARSKMQVASKTTSINGQFICLLSKGDYYVTIETRDASGTYTLAATSLAFPVTGGSINRRFEI